MSLLMLYGCDMDQYIDSTLSGQPLKKDNTYEEQTRYYDKFFKEMIERGHIQKGTTETVALDSLPKGQGGEVNWTTAVVEGYINPKGSLEPDYEEEPPLDLNVFIEAKVPLMSNVLFPHNIHTYWLSCQVCHPKIFIPMAGANPITMNEIFDGKWCGVCHGKVAFNFFPIANCRRCHIVMKGESLQNESWR